RFALDQQGDVLAADALGALDRAVQLVVAGIELVERQAIATAGLGTARGTRWGRPARFVDLAHLGTATTTRERERAHAAHLHIDLAPALGAQTHQVAGARLRAVEDGAEAELEQVAEARRARLARLAHEPLARAAVGTEDGAVRPEGDQRLLQTADI